MEDQDRNVHLFYEKKPLYKYIFQLSSKLSELSRELMKNNGLQDLSSDEVKRIRNTIKTVVNGCERYSLHASMYTKKVSAICEDLKLFVELADALSKKKNDRQTFIHLNRLTSKMMSNIGAAQVYGENLVKRGLREWCKKKNINITVAERKKKDKKKDLINNMDEVINKSTRVISIGKRKEISSNESSESSDESSSDGDHTDQDVQNTAGRRGDYRPLKRVRKTHNPDSADSPDLVDSPQPGPSTIQPFQTIHGPSVAQPPQNLSFSSVTPPAQNQTKQVELAHLAIDEELIKRRDALKKRFYEWSKTGQIIQQVSSGVIHGQVTKCGFRGPSDEIYMVISTQ